MAMQVLTQDLSPVLSVFRASFLSTKLNLNRISLYSEEFLHKNVARRRHSCRPGSQSCCQPRQQILLAWASFLSPWTSFLSPQASFLLRTFFHTTLIPNILRGHVKNSEGFTKGRCSLGGGGIKQCLRDIYPFFNFLWFRKSLQKPFHITFFQFINTFSLFYML